MSERPLITLLNGSVHGAGGVTQRLLLAAVDHLAEQVDTRIVVLQDEPFSDAVEALLEGSAGFIVGTGTYWDSWGSPLQRFLEDASALEGSPVWLGKPAGVVVTMHSVGGKGVLSRLQGVLNVIGAVLPPMSGIVCSYAAQQALLHDSSGLAEDLWRPSDLEIVCWNVLEAVNGRGRWRTWPVDRDHASSPWLDM